MTHARTVAIVRASLIEVFANVDGWFERPVDERAFRPASQGWTIDQVLEHISLTNHFLMLTLRKSVEKAVRRAAAGQSIPAGDSDLDRLEAIGQRGSFPWMRPEHMEPSGRTTPVEVRLILRRQGQECLALLDRLNQGEGALCQLRMSVNALGRIDLYQWLYFLAQHARRHLQQMASIEDEIQHGEDHNMDSYDPDTSRHSGDWLQTDEAERIALVSSYHRRTKIHLPNAQLHAVIHVVVENQLALGEEVVVETLVRLQKEGLSRHDALHAIGSVLAVDLYELMQESSESTGDAYRRYLDRLQTLTAKNWRAG